MNRSVFLVPSTYGLIGWLVAVFFTVLNPVGMNPLSMSGYFIVGYTLFVFAIMTVIFSKPFSKSMYKSSLNLGKADLYIFVLTSTIGLWSLYGYVGDITAFFGGVNNVLHIIYSGALRIRGNAEEFTSLFVQLSYFSWISIFVGVLILKSKNYSLRIKVIVFAVVLVELFLNLFFIDRTRPVWILFTSALGVIFSGAIHNKKLGAGIAYVTAIPAVVFVIFAYSVKKFNTNFGIFGTLSAYIVSGIGYIDDLSNDLSVNISYYPVRTFLPVSKVLEALGLTSNVPDNVLADRYIPFPTNVGTLHEPFVSDGGMLFLVILFPLMVMFINYIAYVGYTSRKSLGLFLWANCVFCLIISFFVPKYNSVPFYLFILSFFVLHQIFRQQEQVRSRLFPWRIGLK